MTQVRQRAIYDLFIDRIRPIVASVIWMLYPRSISVITA